MSRRPHDHEFEMPSLRVDGQVALVTGSSRGLGLGMALALAHAELTSRSPGARLINSRALPSWCVPLGVRHM